MRHKSKLFLIVAAALGAIVFAGYVGASFKSDDTVIYQANGQANHHLLHEIVE